MNRVTSIDPAVFRARVNPQRQAEQAGRNRVDRKPDAVPSDPCEPPAFGEPGVCHTCETVLIAGDVDYKPGSPRRRWCSNNRDRQDSRISSTHQNVPSHVSGAL